MESTADAGRTKQSIDLLCDSQRMLWINLSLVGDAQMHWAAEVTQTDILVRVPHIA